MMTSNWEMLLILLVFFFAAIFLSLCVASAIFGINERDPQDDADEVNYLRGRKKRGGM